MNRYKNLATGIVGLIVFLIMLGYFYPFQAGWCGESPVIKLRYQVALYDIDDYGNTDIVDVLFETNIAHLTKYGGITIHRRIGGMSEYLGITEVKCD